MIKPPQPHHLIEFLFDLLPSSNGTHLSFQPDNGHLNIFLISEFN